MLLDFIGAIHLLKSAILAVRREVFGRTQKSHVRVNEALKQDEICCRSKVLTYLIIKLVIDKKFDLLYHTVYLFEFKSQYFYF